MPVEVEGEARGQARWADSIAVENGGFAASFGALAFRSLAPLQSSDFRPAQCCGPSRCSSWLDSDVAQGCYAESPGFGLHWPLRWWHLG